MFKTTLLLVPSPAWVGPTPVDAGSAGGEGLKQRKDRKLLLYSVGHSCNAPDICSEGAEGGADPVSDKGMSGGGSEVIRTQTGLCSSNRKIQSILLH